jgi:hypothetical protein
MDIVAIIGIIGIEGEFTRKIPSRLTMIILVLA